MFTQSKFGLSVQDAGQFAELALVSKGKKSKKRVAASDTSSSKKSKGNDEDEDDDDDDQYAHED